MKLFSLEKVLENPMNQVQISFLSSSISVSLSKKIYLSTLTLRILSDAFSCLTLRIVKAFATKLDYIINACKSVNKLFTVNDKKARLTRETSVQHMMRYRGCSCLVIFKHYAFT